MRFFEVAAQAVRLGREYTIATDAALEAIEQGLPIDEIVRAFAAETNNEFDDRAVEILIQGLDQAAETLEQVVGLATRWSPEIAEWGVKALVWGDKLRRLRGSP